MLHDFQIYGLAKTQSCVHHPTSKKKWKGCQHGQRESCRAIMSVNYASLKPLSKSKTPSWKDQVTNVETSHRDHDYHLTYLLPWIWTPTKVWLKHPYGGSNRRVHSTSCWRQGSCSKNLTLDPTMATQRYSSPAKRMVEVWIMWSNKQSLRQIESKIFYCSSFLVTAHVQSRNLPYVSLGVCQVALTSNDVFDVVLQL